MIVSFEVGYPPSVNHTKYRSGKLRESVKEYRRSVGWAYKAAQGRKLDGTISVELELYKPAVNVPYDVDNAPHNILNALKGVAYDDDDQIHLLVVAKMWSDGAGRAVVRIRRIGAAVRPGG